MAKNKKDLLAEAKELGLDVTDAMKVDEIKDAIAGATPTADAKVSANQADTKAKTDVAEMLDVQSKTDDSGAAKVAKAGKRSTKGIKESEAKAEKIARQKDGSEESEQPAKAKQPAKPARSRLERRGKKYKEAAKLVEKDRLYSLKPAVDLLSKINTATFDATAELHVRLNVDPKQADQNIRDTIVLPAGTGKDVKVAVFVDADQVASAKKAGADIAGADEFLTQLDKEKLDFDVLISTPQMMGKLGKYARLLGPKGLMPNPKSGTVTADIEKAVKEAKAGRVEYRVDESGIVHTAFGKLSFGTDKLMQNLEAVLKSIKNNKPASVKGAYIVSAFVAVSMSPSVKLDIADINAL